MVEEKGSDINVAFLFFRFSAPNMQNNSAKSRQNQRIWRQIIVAQKIVARATIYCFYGNCM